MVRRTGVAAVLAVIAVAAAACGGGPSTPAAGSPATSSPAVSGPVDVLYAGSLVRAMETQIGPAFDRATGASFQGFSAGSTALANEIKGRVRAGDVFVSAAPAADGALEGAANGDWVRWYATFGSSSLVIGYTPSSRFAADFRTMPWYRVLTLPGLRVGRTDPATDPKGALTVTALNRAQMADHLTGFAAQVESQAVVFPEETLVGRLQSGQLDAGFFYTLEATPLHLPTAGLGAVRAAATFTVTVLERAPHRAAAVAFVAFLLGPSGRSILGDDGMTITAPRLTGPVGAVPSRLVPLVGG